MLSRGEDADSQTHAVDEWLQQIDRKSPRAILHFAHYNFCQLYGTLRVTPAMEAGITDHVWKVFGVARIV